MNKLSQIIQKEHITRHTKAQKASFRNFIVSELGKNGINATIQSGKSSAVPVHNIVIGNPDTAEYLITAHYDTPNTSIFPVIMFADSFVLSLLSQLASFLPVIFLGYIMSEIMIKYNLNPLLYPMVLYGGIYLSVFAFTNKNNFNDNTSGVVCVLDILFSLSEEERRKCTFILFDNEEKGLLGSAYLYKNLKNRNVTVFNIDCIGDGDEIRIFYKEKFSDSDNLMAKLENTIDRKTVKAVKRSFRNILYMSDDYSFPKGVCFAAFQSGAFGKYISKIHSNLDTVLDEENVKLVSKGIADYIRQA